MAKKVALVEAVPGKMCLCGCGYEAREGSFWAGPGHDHKAMAAVIRLLGGTANVIATLGITPARIAAANREAAKAKGAKKAAK